MGLSGYSGISGYSGQNGVASPGGLNTQVQYNNGGALTGNANFTYTGTDVNVPFGPSNTASPISRVALAISMIS